MAISTKPGGKYDTENGQYVSDGSSDAEQSKKQEPTKMQKIGEALKEYNNKRFYIPLNFLEKETFQMSRLIGIHQKRYTDLRVKNC